MNEYNENNRPAQDAPTGRRRRTVRFAGLIDENDSLPPEETPAAESASPADGPAQSVPAETQAIPPATQAISPAPTGTRVNTPVQPRESVVPSQGVPRPAALSGQRPHREQSGQSTQAGPVVRRPVQAEGYEPLQQLGTPPAARARRPEPQPRADMPRRVRTPEADRTRTPDSGRGGFMPPENDQPEQKAGKALIVIIIALLMLAAFILGLILIPEEDPGFLGSMKRAVTEPIKGLLGGGEDNDPAQPATASGFTATISKATAPYKVVFHMVTSANVTAVRVADENGEVIPTTTTLSTPSSESATVWMFEMTRSEDFSGSVQAQIQSGDAWTDTNLWQTLSLGGAAPSTVTGAPAALPTLTATSVPTKVPETPVPAVTDEPEDQPPATATPTLSVTATPTMVPTPEPTEEPTPEPTEVPTPTPSPTPVATPRLEAMADKSADPSLITVEEIYKDNRKATSYERKEPMNMPAGDDYLKYPAGVVTFRGNAFRQNAASGSLDAAPASLSLLWTVEAGSVAGSSRNYYGIGWTGQPVISRWASDVRKSMELEQARRDQKNLTEVIVAGLDGKIYFLDLKDGSATREAIDFGYPMRSTPSLDPLNYPLMTSGQYARKMKSGTSDDIGMYYFDLMNRKELRLVDGIDRKLDRPYNAVGAFDTSALIDRTSHTLIGIGTNGLLFTEKLDRTMSKNLDTGLLEFKFKEPTETVTLMSHTKNQKNAYAACESSLAMYGSYAYYADLDGVLRCVDTTTMKTAWAVETGDAVRAAIALDLEEGETANTLWLYTANLVNNRGTKGNVTIRRYNAMTGEQDWAYAIHCADTKKKDVTFNATVIPGAMASPVIGQKGLNKLVYFTLSSVSAKGAAEAGMGESAIPGVIIALDKESGKVVWHKTMEAYAYSSPVAVYGEDGKGWIIQACSNGLITLMDGLTGETVNTLQVSGVIEGSPAVYDDTLVIGTTGKDTSYIYGIKIN